MLKRILIALIGVPLIVFTILNESANNICFLIFLIFLNILGLDELNYMLKLKNIKINRIFLIISGVTIIITNYFKSPLLTGFAFFVFIFLFLISEIFKKQYKNSLLKFCGFVFALFYISYLSSYFFLLKMLPNGKYYLLLIVILIWVNDSFAYFGGMLFGKKKLKIKASPNKSYAGVISGILFSIFTVFIVSEFLKKYIPFTVIQKFFIGIIFGTIVILSDLVESVFKRSVGIKDSKNFLPGHGGVLDVFDSWFLTIPLFYYYLVFFII